MTDSPAHTLTVLALFPSREGHVALRQIFRHSNWRLITSEQWSDTQRILREQSLRLVICDECFPDADWTGFLDTVSQFPDVGFLVASARAEDRLWTEALNQGVLEVLPKPFSSAHVLKVISGAARQILQKSERKIGHSVVSST